ncbi:tetratricopeptide repeat protein [Longispora albida]|uniref:tetratricopeptide repeat protein n=1 Tax=Longispora albida TaxID=203523 RepID=UPI000364F57B|nr:hypothetical protein [Longispora albida]
MRTIDELRDMLGDAWRMPYGSAQIAAVEEVIRHADAGGHADVQYAARMLATNAYQYGGEESKSFVTFAWCLAAYDRGEAEARYNHSLFWHFKWMIGNLTRFPEIPLDRTRAVLADMERRYQLAGHGMQPVHKYKHVLARHIGDEEASAEEYRQWQIAPRVEMSDCIGCDPAGQVGYLSSRGEYEEAVAQALPVLNGQLDCTEQPQSILTRLLKPYVRTGRLAEARDAHRKAYRLIQANRAELYDIADHIAFCALTGNEARGLELLGRHLDWLETAPSPMAEMTFSAAAGLLLGRLAGLGHGAVIVGRSERSVAELHKELSERATALGARFDARNGTSHQGDWVAERLVEEPWIDYLPLTAVQPLAPPAPVTEPDPVPTVDSSLTAAELADLAEGTYDEVLEAGYWRRFDEVCPEPEGRLLALRLVARGYAERAEAQKHWSRAAELFAQAGDEVRRLECLGRVTIEVIEAGGVSEEQLAELAAAAEYMAAHGTPAQASTACGRYGLAFLLSGRAPEAVEVLTGSLELAEQAGRPQQIAGARMRLAQANAALGTEDGLREAIGLVGLALPGLAGEDLSLARLFRGRMHQSFGELDESTADYRAVMAGLPGTPQAASAGMELAGIYLHIGKPDEAALVAEDALSILVATGDEEAGRCRFILSKAYADLGQTDQAITLLDDVIAECAAEENHAGEGQLREEAAGHLDMVDRDAEAAAQFGLAADAYKKMGLDLDELRARRRSALSWQWAGDPGQALAVLGVADETASTLESAEPQAVWELAMLGYDAARILANHDRAADALTRIEPVADMFRGIEASFQAATASTLHGRLLLQSGQQDEAVRVLEAALAELPAEAPQRPQVEALLAEAKEETEAG